MTSIRRPVLAALACVISITVPSAAQRARRTRGAGRPDRGAHRRGAGRRGGGELPRPGHRRLARPRGRRELPRGEHDEDSGDARGAPIGGGAAPGSRPGDPARQPLPLHRGRVAVRPRPRRRQRLADVPAGGPARAGARADGADDRAQQQPGDQRADRARGRRSRRGDRRARWVRRTFACCAASRTGRRTRRG